MKIDVSFDFTQEEIEAMAFYQNGMTLAQLEEARVAADDQRRWESARYLMVRRFVRNAVMGLLVDAKKALSDAYPEPSDEEVSALERAARQW